ncbi:hypothetical protein [Streptomyces sp. DT117]|uniref:hypothetical protein n=1 Tax=Streptomyces sp. DT117 TaxID=3393422 RepID=UPI003CEB97AC
MHFQRRARAHAELDRPTRASVLPELRTAAPLAVAAFFVGYPPIELGELLLRLVHDDATAEPEGLQPG